MAQPIEGRTLAATLDDLGRRGYTRSFEPTPGGLRLTDAARTYRPDELRIVEHHRFEGTTDPGDMSVVYALEAADGTRGVLVDAFGTYADPALGAVVRSIPDHAEPRRPAA
jgi:hypothetical protein